MKYRYLVYFLISLFLAGSNFLITFNIITSVILLVIFSLFFYLFFEKYRSKYLRNMNRSFEAINFINNFIISLSINPSLVYALENARNSASKNLKMQLDSISHLNIEEQIEYLYKYFELPLYGVFINIIKQYVFNGGDILDMSQALIRDSRALEDRLYRFESISRSKFREFITSWLLTFVILFVLQFSISSIYNSVHQIENYPIMIFVFYFIFLTNLTMMTNRIYDISFMTKGDSYVKETKTKNSKPKTKSKKRIFKIFNR